MKGKTKNLVILAPLSGFTGSAFRRLARELGADWTWSELISPHLVLAKGTKVAPLFFVPEERPLRVQLFGNDPKALSQAAEVIFRELAPDGLDLNAGCPAKKVIKTGAGAALLEDLPRLYEICRELASLARDFGSSFSVKFRLGTTEDRLEEITETLLRAGVEVLALHPRLAKEGFSGKARWERVRALKEMVGQEAQVYLSGDVKTWQDFYLVLETTGADGIMIGRAALARPWIFAEIKAQKTLEPSPSDRMAYLEKLYRYAQAYLDEEAALRLVKLLAPKILRGVPGRRRALPEILEAQDASSFLGKIRALLAQDPSLASDEQAETHR